MTSLPHIAFLGIGLMGLPMASRLCRAGYPITAWNRSAAKAQPLLALGAHVAATASEAVRQADIVISMLENGPVTHDVLFGPGPAARAMQRGALVVDMASIKPEEARHHAALLAALGVAQLDAPVSGGTGGAQQGTLAIMAGGSEADFARAAPVLAHLGRPTHVGPVGAGQLCKLANQLVVAISIGAVAEAMLLVQAGGADPAKFKQAITGGWADSTIMQIHGQRMIERDFAKRGAMAVQLKDLNNVASTAADFGIQLPIASLLQGLFAGACEAGDGGLDHSALYLALERSCGVLEK